jgi:DNA-binding GntR family transcriptional regulator
LQVRPLAAELGVSTTPVREALTRLAAERLVVASPHRGFFVRIASEQEIRGLYCVNQALLDAALERRPETSADSRLAAAAAISVGLAHAGDDAEALTRATGELFSFIADLPGIDALAQIVRNVSDRLYRVRWLECGLLSDVHAELATLATLLAQQRTDRLRAALRAYHERRQGQATALCRELVIGAYVPAARQRGSL